MLINGVSMSLYTFLLLTSTQAASVSELASATFQSVFSSAPEQAATCLTQEREQLKFEREKQQKLQLNISLDVGSNSRQDTTPNKLNSRLTEAGSSAITCITPDRDCIIQPSLERFNVGGIMRC